MEDKSIITFIKQIIRIVCGACVIGIFVAIGFAFYATNREIQPALYWINIMAPNAGDMYSAGLVIALTMLTLLVPFCAIIAVLIRILSLLDRPKGPIFKITSETDIIRLLLKQVKNQFAVSDHAQYIVTHRHPKFGDLVFKLETREMDSPDFEIGTLALDFSVNQCKCSLKTGKKEKILTEIEKYLADPEPIIEDLSNYYRMLFDYS